MNWQYVASGRFVCLFVCKASGRCCLGTKVEVFDDEAHAVIEALEYLNTLSEPPLPLKP
jgi:hypothetical protein